MVIFGANLNPIKTVSSDKIKESRVKESRVKKESRVQLIKANKELPRVRELVTVEQESKDYNMQLIAQHKKDMANCIGKRKIFTGNNYIYIPKSTSQYYYTAKDNIVYEYNSLNSEVWYSYNKRITDKKGYPNLLAAQRKTHCTSKAIIVKVEKPLEDPTEDYREKDSENDPAIDVEEYLKKYIKPKEEMREYSIYTWAEKELDRMYWEKTKKPRKT
jgi:hypothetical protein